MSIRSPRGPRQLYTLQLLVVAVAAAALSSVATWAVTHAMARTSRVAASLFRYQQRWEANAFLGAQDAANAKLDHTIYVALQRTDLSRIQRPKICFAKPAVSYGPDGKALKGAVLVIWIGFRPEADAVVLKSAVAPREASRRIAIPEYQSAGNNIGSRIGVVYSAVLTIPDTLVARLPGKASTSHKWGLIALSMKGKRTSRWFALSR